MFFGQMADVSYVSSSSTLHLTRETRTPKLSQPPSRQTLYLLLPPSPRFIEHTSQFISSPTLLIREYTLPLIGEGFPLDLGLDNQPQ